MSGLDTHLEKQPISPINGQTGDINKDSSAKGVTDKHLAALEGTKETIDTETFLASCHGELGEGIKDNEDKVKESNKETAVNGIEESVGEQENGLPWSEASHVEETKHSETCSDLEDGKQVDSEGGDLKTGMEYENAAGNKDPEPKTEVVAMETKEEQGQSSTESKERNSNSESVTPVTSDEQRESSAKNKDPEESLFKGVGICSNEHEDKSSLEIKEAENSAATDDLETNVVKHGEDKQNGESTCITPAAVEMKREHVEASGVKKESELSLEVNGETGVCELGNNHTKPEEEEGDDPSMSEEALNGGQLEGHSLERTKVAEIEPGTEDKSAASPDSSPNALKQKSNENETKPDQPIPAGVAAGSETSPIKEQEDDSKRSRTKWYTSDQPEDTPTKPEISATSEESISYSTTIVGGVVHRMPISSSSPKGQHKPIRQGSPQTPPKKKTVLGSLLGRPKKLKGGPENPAGPFTDGKGDKNKEQKGLPEAATVAENSEKDTVEKPSEASSVAGVDSANETEKDTAEPLENEKNPDVENVGVIKTEKGTEDEEEAVEQEDVDGKPAAMKVDEEGIKAKTVGAEDEPKQDEKDLQDVTEGSVAAKNVKNSDGSTEGPKNEDSKEAVQSTSESRGSTGEEVHASGVPTAKKSKSAGIFGGFFARRKSKKSTSPSEGKTVEKKEDKIEESQHVDSSAQLSGEVSGTEQGTSSDGAAAKGEQDLTVPPKVVTEDDHHPAGDETTDSGVSEIVDKDKDKVDTADVGEDPEAKENVKEKTDVENTVSGNIQELSQETLQSEETSKIVKKVAKETTAFVAKDSEPEVQQVEQNLTQPKTEVSNVSAAEGETGNDKPKPEEPKNDEAPMQTVLTGETSPLEKKTTRNEVVDGLHVNDDEESGIKRSSSFGAAAKKLPGGRVGFGNLINPNILAEKKLKKVHQDEKRENKGKTEETFVPTTEPSKPSLVKTKTPVSSKARPAPPVPPSSPVKKPGERAKVTFAYEPENPDELRLVEGDIVTILNKDTAESDGWWEGEVNGKVGMFPNNFVVLLPSEEDDKAPVPAVDGKKGALVLPLKDEIIKSPNESDSDATPEHAVSPVRPDKRPPHLATKEQPPSKNAVPSQPIKDDSDSSTDVVRPTPGKKPVAPQKPSLPPKKPLPLKSKKPDVAAKKPEKKLVDSDKIAGAKKGGDEAELKDEVRIKPTPDIKSENVDEAPVSFDDAPETETLNHLTANRAKHPQKRPPSKEGRSTNSPRHSLNMEDDHPETIKQPPGRPKEPPKEPAWKREVREAREKKQVADEKAPFPALAHKSDEAHTRASPVQKVEPFATGTPGELDKLRKEVSELREILSKMEKKHGDMIKKLQEEFFREIESLTNDLDEEKKKNAAEHASHKVEIERLKRRQTRFNLEETQ